MFRRKIEKTLDNWRKDPERKSLLISGARQVGKTTSVRHFGQQYESFIEINFELKPEMKRLFSGNLDTVTLIGRMKDAFGREAMVPGETLIFLDEIQSCPAARTSLKSFTEDRDWDVIASGSLLGVNYREIPSYPVGYETPVTMHPMDFEEYLSATGVSDDTISSVKEHVRLKEQVDEYEFELMNRKMREYMVAGGMPEAVRTLVDTGDFDLTLQKLTVLKEQYRNDAAKYAVPKDRNRIFDCFRSIPDQLAKEDSRFMYADVMRASESDTADRTPDGSVTKKGAREYRASVDWLIDAGICLECKRVNELMPPIRSKENLFKLYMCDTGILTSMMPGAARSILDPSFPSNKGPIGEDLVATMLHRHGVDVYYYKKKTTEVDFVTDFDGIMTAMEVKSGNNNKSKSLDSVMRDGRVQRGMKFERTNTMIDDRGVEHYPLFAAGFMDCLFEKRPLPRMT